jgi:hypothetical protein
VPIKRGECEDDAEWRHGLKHACHTPQVIIEQNVKLVVVDSVAAIVRREFSKSSLIERQGVLAREAQILKQRENHPPLSTSIEQIDPVPTLCTPTDPIQCVPFLHDMFHDVFVY